MTRTCTHPFGARCALIDAPALAKDFRAGMVQLEIYIDTSHESLELWRCRSCGQHWLWWWCETWDFEAGNDPVASSLTLVSGPEEARSEAALPGAGAPAHAPPRHRVDRSDTNGTAAWHRSEPA